MIRLYSSPTCGPCGLAADKLKAQRVPFEKLNIQDDLAAKEVIMSRGFRSVPVFEVETDDGPYFTQDINKALLVHSE